MSGLPAIADDLGKAFGVNASTAARILDEFSPKIACYYEGHPGLPGWKLHRFRNQPWRCARCKAWMITRAYFGDGGQTWSWEDVTKEAE